MPPKLCHQPLCHRHFGRQHVPPATVVSCVRQVSANSHIMLPTDLTVPPNMAGRAGAVLKHGSVGQEVLPLAGPTASPLAHAQEAFAVCLVCLVRFVPHAAGAVCRSPACMAAACVFLARCVPKQHACSSEQWDAWQKYRTHWAGCNKGSARPCWQLPRICAGGCRLRVEMHVGGCVLTLWLKSFPFAMCCYSTRRSWF